MDSHYKGYPGDGKETTKLYHQVQRRGISLTLAELLVLLIFVCFISFGGGYWLSREHSNDFHAGAYDFHAKAYDKLQIRHNEILKAFADIETRVGLLEGKEKKRGWRVGP